MALTAREKGKIIILTNKMVNDLYELVQDELCESVEGDSAKEVSEKMGEGWVLMLKQMLEIARQSGEII